MTGNPALPGWREAATWWQPVLMRGAALVAPQCLRVVPVSTSMRYTYNTYVETIYSICTCMRYAVVQ